MAHSNRPIFVIDQDGVRGIMDAHAMDNSEQTHVMVTYDGDRHVQVPATMLQHQSDDTYRLPLRLSTLENDTQQLTGDATTVIPIIQEEAHIDKRTVEYGRVRVTKQVHTQEETVDVPLKQERVQIERIPIEQIVDAPASIRYEGEILVIPVIEEVLVVEKKLFLKEEVRIRKYVEETTHQETVTLRGEEVSVERTQ